MLAIEIRRLITHYKPLEEEVWFVIEEAHVVISVHGGRRGTGQSRELLLLI
jgi:hypothetical protein